MTLTTSQKIERTGKLMGGNITKVLPWESAGKATEVKSVSKCKMALQTSPPLCWTSRIALPNPPGILSWVDSQTLMENGLWQVALLSHQTFLDNLKVRSHSAFAPAGSLHYGTIPGPSEKSVLLWGSNQVSRSQIKARVFWPLEGQWHFCFHFKCVHLAFPQYILQSPGLSREQEGKSHRRD